MKSKISFSIFALVLAAGVTTLSAAPVACPTGMLNDYLTSGFSCDQDGQIFSSFSYASSASGGATALPASGIVVVPYEDGFEFIGDWTATSGQTTDSVILFQDQVPGGLEDTGVAQLASGVLGTGTASVEEEGCGAVAPATSCTPGQWDLFTFNSTTPGLVQLGDATMTSSSGIYDIAKNIAVTGGTYGAVTLSDVADRFCAQVTETPEPTAFLCAGTGLLALGLMRFKRHRSKQS